MGADAILGTEFADRYRIEGKIGQGGMGVVYRATDLQLKRQVALKVLADSVADQPTARTRFLKEIDVATAMSQHPNIVTVFDGGIADDRFYFTMQLIESPDLGSLCAGGPLEFERTVRLLRQICEALRYIHDAGYVHRDIKPTNVLVWEEGARWELAQLADFGIVRALSEDSLLTKAPPGSFAYMAPEAIEWQQPTPNADQYSLAVMGFEMSSGRRPFREDRLPRAHCDEPVPSLAQVAPTLPPQFCAAIERGLAKDPDDRFADIEKFGEALAPLEPTPVPAPTPTPGDDEAVGLLDEVIAVLGKRPGWIELEEIAREVNERGRYRSPSGKVTAADLDRRTVTFSRRFRRRGSKVKLRAQS